MKKVLLFVSLLFLVVAAQSQIETITIEDLADTTLLDDTTHLARFGGITPDGSLTVLPQFCVDSNGCVWIKDTAGVKRIKLNIDTNNINIGIFIGVVNNFFNWNIKWIFPPGGGPPCGILQICGIKKWERKFGKFVIQRNFVDTVGIVHCYQDTTAKKTIKVIYQPDSCRIITQTEGKPIRHDQVFDSLGYERQVRDTSNNSITERMEPGKCEITTSSSWSQFESAQRFDSTGVTSTVRDTSGREMSQRVDPVSCTVTNSSNKSPISRIDQLDSTGGSTTYKDSLCNTITQRVDLAECKITTSTSKSAITVMQRLDSLGAESTVMDTSGNAISDVRSPSECKVSRSTNKSSTVVSEVITPSGSDRTVADGEGPSSNSITETTDASGQVSCLGGSSNCITRQIKGNLDVTKNISADSIIANAAYIAEFRSDIIIAGIVDAISIVALDKSFAIPHPLDPDNKMLIHSCIEGPERMNIYNGKVVTDAEGFAAVRMPDYFTALNRDFKYNLTILGKSFAQAIVWEEMSRDGEFVIRTNEPGIKVSWQVMGTRQDQYAKDHPFITELTNEEFRNRNR